MAEKMQNSPKPSPRQIRLGAGSSSGMLVHVLAGVWYGAEGSLVLPLAGSMERWLRRRGKLILHKQT